MLHSLTEPNRRHREHSAIYQTCDTALKVTETWSNHWAMADVDFGVAAGVLGELRSQEGFRPFLQARRPVDENFNTIAVLLSATSTIVASS